MEVAHQCLRNGVLERSFSLLHSRLSTPEHIWNVLSINTQSMRNKQEEQETLAQSQSYGIIDINETWRDDSCDWCAVMAGYRLYRRDGWGGQRKQKIPEPSSNKKISWGRHRWPESDYMTFKGTFQPKLFNDSSILLDRCKFKWPGYVYGKGLSSNNPFFYRFLFISHFK